MAENVVENAAKNAAEKRKGEIAKEANGRNIESFEEFAKSRFGLDISQDMLSAAAQSVKIQTVYGTITLADYRVNLVGKLYEYYTTGVAYRVYEMMNDQLKGNVSKKDVLVMLTMMAEKELKYGLQPLEHMIPIKKQLFVTFPGLLHYAHRTGLFKGFCDETVEVKPDGTVHARSYVVKVVDGQDVKFCGEGEVDKFEQEKNNAMKNLAHAKQMALKRARAAALKIAFPIGYDLLTDANIAVAREAEAYDAYITETGEVAVARTAGSTEELADVAKEDTAKEEVESDAEANAL